MKMKMRRYILVIAVFAGLVFISSGLGLNLHTPTELTRPIPTPSLMLPTPSPMPSLTPTSSPIPHIPEPYYLNVTKGARSITELNKTLNEIRYSHPYERHVFDCSEMSALVEHYLENHGFHASIIISKTHAWVVAHNITDVEGANRDIHIEAVVTPPYSTHPHIIFPLRNIDLSDFLIFQDIYQARDYGWYYALDWWNVPQSS